MSKIEERRLNAREKFLEVVEKDGYTLLDEYVNTETKVKMICPKGHDYITTPHNFKSGYRCPKCSGKCKEQASEDFYKCVKEFNYKCITKYEKGNIYISTANLYLFCKEFNVSMSFACGKSSK